MNPRIKSPFGRIAVAIVCNIVILLLIMLPVVLTGSLDYVLDHYGVESAMNILIGVVATTVTLAVYRHIDRGRIGTFSLRLRRKDILFSLGAFAITSVSALTALWLMHRNGGLNVGFDANRVLTPSYVSLALFAFIAWVFAAMQEEALSRGYMLANMHRYGIVKGVLISSVLFFVVHLPFRGFEPYHAISIVLGGIVYAYMYIKSGSLFVSAIAHGIYDYVDGLVFNVSDASLFILRDSLSMSDKLPYKLTLAALLLLFTYLVYGRNGLWTPAATLKTRWEARTFF